jgi:starch synthase
VATTRRALTREPLLRSPGGEAAAVVHLTAEYLPYARTGGLAEAVAGLAAQHAATGLSTTVIMPYYRLAWERAPETAEPGEWFTVRVGHRDEPARLHCTTTRAGRARMVFVEHPGYFDRAGIYGEGGGDYADNSRRFAFLSAAALQVLPLLGDGPLVLHAHDWHTALAPVYLRVGNTRRALAQVATVLSVHNAGYQGHYPFEVLADLGLPAELWHWSRLEWYGKANLLKGGLVSSNLVTTVSPTHAHELRTDAGGFGLHDTFIALGNRLVGILNGIDPVAWNPATDRFLEARYSAEDLTGKAACKDALQRGWGLEPRVDVPLFGMSARMVEQKGFDLVLASDAVAGSSAQFVFLGTGEPRYEDALRRLAAGASGRVAVETGFSDRREHELLAGADFLMMPSLYEPCGLTQMRAQRYGALPVARRVGGLADTIEDQQTGFLFDEYAGAALDVALRRAASLFEDGAALQTHRREAMGRDFSWARSAEKYLDVYRRALSSRP